MPESGQMEESVLIETLWNVKDEVFAVKSRKILY